MFNNQNIIIIIIIFHYRSKSSEGLKNSGFSKSKRGVVDGLIDNDTEHAFDIADIYEDDRAPGEMNYTGGGADHEDYRDLSAWRVTIPKVVAKTSGGKSHFVFVIDVQRIDVTSRKGNGEDLHWTVSRRHSEFYALESKLTEFHGEFEGDQVKLPAKAKLFSGKGLDAMQEKQQPFEEYLIKLLQKPSLKESDILFTFLTSTEEFTIAASKLGLAGKMMKNVNVKLTKEKGQSLQPFINSFIQSTQCAPPKPRYDWIMSEFDHDSDRKLKINPLFGNNIAEIKNYHQETHDSKNGMSLQKERRSC